MALAFSDVIAARARIQSHITRTPVLTNDALDDALGAKIFFKCENLQASGAFKARGACNAVFAMSDTEAARGVVTHSSGNHGAALARAAQRRGIPGYVVMPHNAPVTKVRNVESYGAKVVFCEPTLQAREGKCAELIAQTGARLVHPFDDFAVMAGQGTACVELMENVAELDAVVCPVGGGGLISGVATAAKHLRPQCRVVGVEPELGNDVQQSVKAGRRIAIATPATLADGLRSNQVGEHTFEVIREKVDGVVTVSEAELIAAMRELWERLKIVVEPSGAVPFAAVRSGAIEVRGRRVGVILTGGNVDLDVLPWQTRQP